MPLAPKVLAGLAAAAVLNAFVARYLAAGATPSALEIVAALLPIVTLAATRESLRIPIWLGIGATALLLVPSAAFAWLSLGLLATSVMARAETAPTRRAGVVLLGVAGLELTISVLIKPVAPVLLSGEAVVIGALLQAIAWDVVRDANVLQHGDHRVAVLLGCSGLMNAGLALLAWMAWGGQPRRAPLVALGLVLAGFALNSLRMAAMVRSPEAYAWWHGSEGATVADLVLLALVFCAVPASRPTLGLPQLSRRMSVALAALLVVTLAVKTFRYAAPTLPPETDITARVAVLGLSPYAHAPVSSGGAFQRLEFAGPTCKQAVAVVLLTGTSEFDTALRHLYGDDFAVLALGALHETVPTLALQVQALATLIGRPMPAPPVAIAPRPGNDATGCLPSAAEWQHAWR